VETRGAIDDVITDSDRPAEPDRERAQGPKAQQMAESSSSMSVYRSGSLIGL
jgi:hypothetical protein